MIFDKAVFYQLLLGYGTMTFEIFWKIIGVFLIMGR